MTEEPEDREDEQDPSDPGGTGGEATNHLVAVEIAETFGFALEPAEANRAWMSATPDGFARHCLPMLIANQHGWVITNPADVTVEWDGTRGLDAITVTAADDVPDEARPLSHFGDGIITWRLPYLFRTPDDVDLLMRGPANLPKDGASALEGIIEADWSPATGTMNWMLTRPHHPITFTKGEPIAMVLPVPRGYLESFETTTRRLTDDSQLDADYRAWRDGRTTFIEQLAPRQTRRDEWQGDYFRGRVGDLTPRGHHAHQTRLRLDRF